MRHTPVFLAAAWAWAQGPTRVLAQAGTSPDSIGKAVDGLIAYGPLGISLVLVLIGWLVPGPSVARLVEALARAEKQRDDLVSQQATEVLPVLVRVNDQLIPALERSTAADAALRGEITRLVDEVRRLTSVVESSRGKSG